MSEFGVRKITLRDVERRLLAAEFVGWLEEARECLRRPEADLVQRVVLRDVIEALEVGVARLTGPRSVPGFGGDGRDGITV